MHAIIVAVATVLLALWPAGIGAQCDQCEGDFNGDGEVTIDEIIVSVNNALDGCPPPGEPTDTPVPPTNTAVRPTDTPVRPTNTPGPRFTDNGDGTITDTQTGLQWEKKSNDGSMHDQDNAYTWSTGSPSNPDGTVFTSFLTTLNSVPCFASHCDWRLPSLAELQSLVDYGRFAPAIDAVFNTGCKPGCTVMTCSCTLIDYYWSMLTLADLSDFAWNVDFNYGYVNGFEKTLSYPVRAVRDLP